MKKYGLFGLIALVVVIGIIFAINTFAEDGKVIGNAFLGSDEKTINYLAKFTDNGDVTDSMLYEAANKLWFSAESTKTLTTTTVMDVHGGSITLLGGESNLNGGNIEIAGGRSVGNSGYNTGDVYVHSGSRSYDAEYGNVYLNVDQRGNIYGDTYFGGKLCEINSDMCYSFSDFISNQFEDINVNNINSKGDLVIDIEDGDLVALDGVVLVSPKGNRYRVTVNDKGVLQTKLI